MKTTFNVVEWLKSNVWEMEDKLTDIIVSEGWDSSVTWITDEDTAMECGLGPKRKGTGLALLINVATRDITPIAWPHGHYFSDGIVCSAPMR